MKVNRFVASALGLFLLLLLARVAAGVLGAPATPNDVPGDLAESCGTDNPYLTTACYVWPTGSEAVANRLAALVAFRDTPADTPHYLLATIGEVGSIYGLAYAAGEQSVYAAAYHRRQAFFGPGGPGAIYRVDLATEDVTLWATVPNAGDDQHDERFGGRDLAAGKWAGKTSLGDIDVNRSGDDLFAVNLFDRRIYRLQVPSGHVLGSFEHGAAGEAWAEDARPFGLKVHDGRVYHGVVRSAESSQDDDDLSAHVYSSLPDGSDMREVVAFPLDYFRGFMVWDWLSDQRVNVALEWHPWTDSPPATARGTTYTRAHPMPMLTDIEFDASGNMVIGLGDRMLDFALIQGLVGNDYTAIGGGDLIQGTPDGDRWSVQVLPEHYDDNNQSSDEFALGALSTIPWADHVVTNAWTNEAGQQRRLDSSGVYWFDALSGQHLRVESVCSRVGALPRLALSVASVAWADDEGPPGGHTGDLELLCQLPDAPTPSPSPTKAPTEAATQVPSASASATVSDTAVPPTHTATRTPTETAVPEPRFLPIALRERCSPEYQRSDIALVIDTSSSMTGQKIEDARAAALSFVGLIDLAPGRSQVAIVRFDRDAELVRELTNAHALIEAAIRNLQVRSGTHIDKGLRTALGELQSPRHLERNAQVLILLTDGVQTGPPGEELRAAVELHAADVLVYTIGLGADVDGATLRTIAGADERYYFAPDSGDLARIYGEIAHDLMCPGVDLWGGR